MSKTIKVFSPATIGNIGPGFDVLGLAVKGMGDIVEVWKSPGDKIIIEEILNADHPISKDPDENTAGYIEYDDIDFVSNGFKLRTAATSMNADGESIIYLAFAENPFKTSNAR